jgi:hypothetical protein
MMRDLAARRQPLQIGERERGRSGDQPVHREPPICKTAGQVAQIRLSFRMLAIYRYDLRNLAPAELAGEWRDISTRWLA